MTHEQYLKNLSVPEGRIDVILDTDAYNEIDDQFAISYMIRHTEKLNVKGICAAPFFNYKAENPADGMKKSYREILNLLSLAHREDLNPLVFEGSGEYLKDEKTPVLSPAAEFIARQANDYSPQNPLYIVAIGAITNVASAILLNPAIAENCVIVWLGGHGIHMDSPGSEFNMVQDIAAARVVFQCGAPLVILPCGGVVDHFATSRYELEHWLQGKNELCDYLCGIVIKEAESYAAGKPWTRVIWDVTTIGWLLNEGGRFMRDKTVPMYLPEYDKTYSFNENGRPITYVCEIRRDALFDDLFRQLAQ